MDDPVTGELKDYGDQNIGYFKSSTTWMVTCMQNTVLLDKLEFIEMPQFQK